MNPGLWLSIILLGAFVYWSVRTHKKRYIPSVAVLLLMLGLFGNGSEETSYQNGVRISPLLAPHVKEMHVTRALQYLERPELFNALQKWAQQTQPEGNAPCTVTEFKRREIAWQRPSAEKTKSASANVQLSSRYREKVNRGFIWLGIAPEGNCVPLFQISEQILPALIARAVLRSNDAEARMPALQQLTAGPFDPTGFTLNEVRRLKHRHRWTEAEEDAYQQLLITLKSHVLTHP